MTRIQMREIMAGAKSGDTAANVPGGQGSMWATVRSASCPALAAYFVSKTLKRCKWRHELRHSSPILTPLKAWLARLPSLLPQWSGALKK